MNAKFTNKSVDMSALKTAFESTQPNPTRVVDDIIDMLSLEFAQMDEAKAHRDEAQRLEAVLVSLKAEYEGLTKMIAVQNAKMFSIGKRVAKTREEAVRSIENSEELKNLEMFLRDKGKIDRWNTVRKEAIEKYVFDVMGSDLDDLNLIKANAPQLIKDAQRLGSYIAQTQDTIASEYKAADDLSKPEITSGYSTSQGIPAAC